MRVGELMQPDSVEREVCSEQIKRQIERDGREHRRLDGEHHDNRSAEIGSHHRLDCRRSQRVERQHALTTFWEAFPVSFEERLQKTLAPTCPLPDELS